MQQLLSILIQLLSKNETVFDRNEKSILFQLKAADLTWSGTRIRTTSVEVARVRTFATKRFALLSPTPARPTATRPSAT